MTLTPHPNPSPGLPSIIPISRLTPIATVNAASAMKNSPLPDGVSLVAGDQGATLLSWPLDDFLQRQLSKLDLSSSWQVHVRLYICIYIYMYVYGSSLSLTSRAHGRYA